MKDIPGYEGLYAITEDGNVWSYPKHRSTNGRFLVTFTDNGYKYVNLHKEKVMVKRRVNRLAALTYIPNPSNKPYVNHIDGIKSNNQVSNLEWNTARENCVHASENGLLKPAKGSSHVRAKLIEEDISSIRLLHAIGHSYAEIADIYGVAAGTIHPIIKGRTWKNV